MSDGPGTGGAAGSPRSAPFDPGLQPERTALAWRRTGLALLIGALVVLRYFTPVLGAIAVGASLLGAALGMVILLRSEVRYRRTHVDLTQRTSARTVSADGLLPALVSAAAVLGGLVCLAFVIVSATS